MTPRFVSRREPVMILEPIRFLRRSYKAGDILDRRRTRMRNGQLSRLIKSGKVVLCRDIPEDKLWEAGYVFDETLCKRYPLKTIAAYKEITLKEEIKAFSKASEDPPEVSKENPVEIIELPEGSYQKIPTGMGDFDIVIGEDLYCTAECMGKDDYDVLIDGELVNVEPIPWSKVEELISKKLKEG